MDMHIFLFRPHKYWKPCTIMIILSVPCTGKKNGDENEQMGNGKKDEVQRTTLGYRHMGWNGRFFCDMMMDE